MGDREAIVAALEDVATNFSCKLQVRAACDAPPTARHAPLCACETQALKEEEASGTAVEAKLEVGAKMIELQNSAQAARDFHLARLQAIDDATVRQVQPAGPASPAYARARHQTCTPLTNGCALIGGSSPRTRETRRRRWRRRRRMRTRSERCAQCHWRSKAAAAARAGSEGERGHTMSQLHGSQRECPFWLLTEPPRS